MASAIVPFAMALGGAVLYVLATNPKIAEIGRILLAAGAFALAFLLAQTRLAI